MTDPLIALFWIIGLGGSGVFIVGGLILLVMNLARSKGQHH